ncbi:hypothetical protein V5O39_15620 [Pseudomonas parakoreensis]
MTKGDQLKLRFHGIAVTPYTVLEGEVGKEISVFISPENIRDAGPANPAVVVYQIEDQVENVSDFSERTTVVSDPDNNWLDPVFVPLAYEDRVSLDEVGFDDLEVQIITRPGFALKRNYCFDGQLQRKAVKWSSTVKSNRLVVSAFSLLKFPIPLCLPALPARCKWITCGPKLTVSKIVQRSMSLRCKERPCACRRR